MQWQVMLISAYRLGIQTGEKKNALFISSSIEQWLTMQFISQSPTRCVITKKVNKILIITAWESVISCRKDQRLSWVFSCSMVWVKRSVNVQQKLASCTWIAPRPSTVTSSITVNKQYYYHNSMRSTGTQPVYVSRWTYTNKDLIKDETDLSYWQNMNIDEAKNKQNLIFCARFRKKSSRQNGIGRSIGCH